MANDAMSGTAGKPRHSSVPLSCFQTHNSFGDAAAPLWHCAKRSYQVTEHKGPELPDRQPLIAQVSELRECVAMPVRGGSLRLTPFRTTANDPGFLWTRPERSRAGDPLGKP
jgi:hypothetical protein